MYDLEVRAGVGGGEAARSWGRRFRQTSWKPCEANVGCFGRVLFVVLFYVKAYFSLLFCVWALRCGWVICTDLKDIFRVRDKKMQMQLDGWIIMMMIR